MIFTVADPILIRKVHEPYGWLGNMSPHPIVLTPEGERWRTTEALFQALRFGHGAPEVREKIRDAKSPMEAKMIAKRHVANMVVKPRSQQDVNAMHLVLLMKLHQYPELLETLLDTGEKCIIEDCSARPSTSALFWGAARVRDMPDTWQGQNQLGILWMSIRADKRAAATGTDSRGGPPATALVAQPERETDLHGLVSAVDALSRRRDDTGEL